MRPRTPGAIHTSQRAEQTAKRLRREPTYAERLLWRELRKLDELHWRRQAPFGPYVVDFCSHPARLIIELDGPVHALFGDDDREAERTGFLVARGYRVIRFENRAVTDDRETVVQRILAEASRDTPTPGPSPQGGGEQ